MGTRRPIVAGQFYPGRGDACVSEIEQFLVQRTVGEDLADSIVAGIVPHAGWTFSGDLACLVFSAIKQSCEKVDTFVLFGAIHSYIDKSAKVYGSGRWVSPLGEVGIDEELAGEIISGSRAAEANEDVHSSEHSIEVQIPFIQYLFPDAKIVPIMTPPDPIAVQVGCDVADCIAAVDGKKVVCIGSTDLTHYGPRYGFVPAGAGEAGIKWAKEVNDRQFIDLALTMQAEELLEKSVENSNACGPGAAAATIAAAKRLGKTKGQLLAHTRSNEVMQRKFSQSSAESVGYAAIVY